MFLLVRIRAPGRRLSTLPQRLDSIAFNPNRIGVEHSLVVSGGGGGGGAQVKPCLCFNLLIGRILNFVLKL